MNLSELPLVRPSYQKKKNILQKDYYAVQKGNEPALIFKCISSNELEVICDGINTLTHGQYESFKLDVIDNREIARLIHKCQNDHTKWLNRYGTDQNNKIDFSILGTKFKIKL